MEKIKKKTPSEARKRLGSGQPCFMKAGKNVSLPVVITETVGYQTWKVQNVELSGGLSGVAYQCKSANLRKWKKGDHHPLVVDDCSKSEASEDACTQENELITADHILISDDGIETIHADATNEEIESGLDATVFTTSEGTEAILEDPTQIEGDESGLDATVITTREGTEAILENVDAEDCIEEDIEEYPTDNEEEDPDAVLHEDIPYMVPGDFEDREGSALPLIMDEIWDDKHEEKRRKYEIEKAALIKSGKSVKLKASSNQTIDIGSQIRERSGAKRVGLVVANDRDNEHNYPCWTVAFEHETVRFVRSSKINLVRDNRVFEWFFSDDSHPTNPVPSYREHGVLGFDFKPFLGNLNPTCKENEYTFPHLKILLKLWPGDWRQQMKNLNIYLHDNKYRIVTPKEWWTFWGIVISAGPSQKAGHQLFEKDNFDCLFPSINFGKDGYNLMSRHRFTELYSHIHRAFDDLSSPEDPYHPIKLIFDGYNENRAENVAGSSKSVSDESMSAFQPRTTKTSILPHLSAIMRKPRPLGTEFKGQNVICPKTGIILFQEIQRGKYAMREQEFAKDVGVTAACTLRLLLGSVYSGQQNDDRKRAKKMEQRQLITGDSWFGSVKLAESMKLLWRDEEGNYKLRRDLGENPNGHEGCFALKTNSSCFPKAELEARMEHWPGGSHLVMKCRCPESGVDLVAIGYKYNSRTTLLFIMTKNAGSTSPGAKPYIARFPDKYGNVKERKVSRPEVIADYFQDSDAIDSHNHCRQFRLGLDVIWLTKNPWKRHVITLVGQTVIDCLRAVKFHTGKDISVHEFAKGLSYDCLYNPFYDGEEAEPPRLYIPADSISTADRLSRFRLESELQTINEKNDVMADDLRKKLAMSRSHPVCGVSLISPLSETSSPTRLEQDMVNIGTHDVIKHHASSSNAKVSVKRHCSICHYEVRTQCNHPGCLSKESIANGKVFYGVTVCDLSKGPRPLKHDKDNKITCIELHRQRMKAEKVKQIHASMKKFF